MIEIKNNYFFACFSNAKHTSNGNHIIASTYFHDNSIGLSIGLKSLVYSLITLKVTKLKILIIDNVNDDIFNCKKICLSPVDLEINIMSYDNYLKTLSDTSIGEFNEFHRDSLFIFKISNDRML